MIELGNSLRAAREEKGYTVRQLSEMTRLAPSTIQDIETENFTHIAAPIYGRGFIKLYCEAIGIDPKPFINEFMEIFNGNRDADIRERPVSDSPAVAAEPVQISAVEPPPPHITMPPPEPVSAPEPDLFTKTSPVEAESEPPLSRYAAPIRNARPDFNPQVFLRIGILVAGAIVLLALLLWGIRSVYRATNGTTTEAEAVETETVKPADTTVPETKAVRTPQKIPSLYID